MRTCCEWHVMTSRVHNQRQIAWGVWIGALKLSTNVTLLSFQSRR